MSSDSENPYALSPGWDELHIAQVRSPEESARRTLWDRGLAVVILLASSLGAVACMFTIESIIVSGPTLAVAGVLLLGRELHCRRNGRQRWSLGLVLSIIGPAFVTCVWTLIYLNSWGPSDAVRHHVDAACALFGLANSIVTLWALRTVRPHSEPLL